MRFRRLKTIALATSLVAAPAVLAPAFAATAAEVKPGMTVVDPAGGTVGTVVGVKGETLLLKTARHEVHLPLASFTAHEGKLLFAMTVAQLDAETEKALAEAAAAVKVGAAVFGRDGTPAGTIEAIEGDLVTVKLTGGEKVRLPRSGVSGSAKGVTLGVTAADLNALANQASPNAGEEAPGGSN